MTDINTLLPELTMRERIFVRDITETLNNEDTEEFALEYEDNRRSPILMLVLTLIGFGGLAGLQRLYMKQYFLAFVYFITCGFFFIGTIYDTFTYKKRTNAYNYKMALRTKRLVEG